MNGKKLAVSVLVVGLLCAQSVYAQLRGSNFGYTGEQGGLLMGGVGFARIGDETYYAIQFRPEFGFGKVGIGLNINLLYDSETGKIRSQDWDSSYDYFRVIRYLRYGHKFDPIYARVGSLDAAHLGHGFIVNYYTNEASYDERKIGLALDIDFGRFGVESITSNLGRAELIGLRGYYRPLYERIAIPIIEHFAVGATFAQDFDPDSWTASDDATSVYGFDLELPLIRGSRLNSLIYFDWAQIRGYSSLEEKTRTFGSGQAVGFGLGLGNLGGLIDLSFKVERRWLGKEFVPAYFDAFYEIERFYMTEDRVERHKTDYLLGLQEKTKGLFGELVGGLLGDRIRLIGMMSWLDEVPDWYGDEEGTGAMHLAAEAIDAFPSIAAHATYDKIRMGALDDLFTLDNRSVARVGLGYKVSPYLILFVDYIWTYEETEPGSRIYQPQERIEPKLVLAYRF
ncbi:hypothetical protein JW992_00535 [candidate division KSB1 bacterium]|nr:hypothetical protein [candidate division KSB1 bacterium]